MTPETQPQPPTSRRSALAGLLNLIWLVPAGLGAAGLLRFLGFYPPTEQPTRFPLDAPTLAALPAYVESAQAWLHRDAGGYYAVDAICTHLGCKVRLEMVTPDYRCDCHGSRFAADGTVLVGPAKEPLRFLWLYRDGEGRAVIDRSQEAGPSFRLPAEG